MKRTLLTILIILLLGVFCFSGYKIWQTYQEYQEGEAVYKNIVSQVVRPRPETPKNTAQNPSVNADAGTNIEDVISPYDPAPIVVDFDALTSINGDVVGWLYCEGTVINYPVVRGTDNEKYIGVTVDGTYNSAGTPFMDFRNSPDLTDRHTIIYGHNMHISKSMFYELLNYTEQSYYDEHPVMYYLTPQGNYCLCLFSGYYTTSGSDSYTIDFYKEGAFESLLERIRAKSDFQPRNVPEDGILLTLSTCGKGNDEERYVLHGFLVPAPQ